MTKTARLKSFTEIAVKELQFADTPPVIIARTMRLIESAKYVPSASPCPGQ